MMPFSTRKDTIFAKAEVSYGVDPIPTGAANAMLVTNLAMKPAEMTLIDRGLNRPYFGSSDQLPGQIYQMVDFDIEMSGSGAAGTAPAWGLLLEACAFGKVVNAGVDVVYSPISAAIPSVTIYCYKDLILHKLTGARGTVSIEVNNQAIPYLKFSFMGKFEPATDVVSVVPVYTAFQKPVIANATNTTPFTFHGINPVTSSLTLNVGANLVYRDLIGGVSEVLITDRQVSGATKFETNSVLAKNWLTTIQAATTAAMSLQHGQAAGNIIVLGAPAVQLIQPQYSEEDFVSMWSMNLRCTPVAGNDELTITVR
jgi:hypothetical protein